MKINSETQAREAVRAVYDEIATEANSCGCCCSPNQEEGIIPLEYENQEGYLSEADLGLGCGIPVAFSRIKQGDTVVDLGSGAGNDVFIAAETVGSSGRVIGIDMTESMLLLGLRNASKHGYTNVDFRLGEIEDLPIARNTADYVISNCVLNLVPDKARAFSEMYRILKPGGEFTVSDVVIIGNLPQELVSAAEVYAACIGGAIEQDRYLDLLSKAGFGDVEILEEKEIGVAQYLVDSYEMKAAYLEFEKNGGKVKSVTVRGVKH